MNRRLSRMAMPAVAAAALAMLCAQPILAATPTMTRTHTEGPNAAIATAVQSACGVTGVSVYSIVDRRTIQYPAGSANGVISSVHTAQRIEVSVGATGATARLAQAATVKTYTRNGHTYVTFSGRNLGYGIAGRVTTRDGVEIARSGHPITLASEICGALTRAAGSHAATNGRGSGASETVRGGESLRGHGRSENAREATSRH